MDFLIAEKIKNAFLVIFKSDYINFRIPRHRIYPWFTIKGNPKAYARRRSQFAGVSSEFVIIPLRSHTYRHQMLQ